MSTEVIFEDTISTMRSYYEKEIARRDAEMREANDSYLVLQDRVGELYGQLADAKREIADARDKAIKECAKILLKHVKKQSAGRCCDNCNCQAVKHTIEGFRSLSTAPAGG